MKCKYYNICGGCSLQHLSYDQQLKFKERMLKDIFGFDIPIERNPKPFGYRTRMDFVYAFGKIGLRKKGSWKYVVDIDECLLISKKANRLFKLIRDNVKKLGIEGYNYVKHEGFVRYFVIRQTKKELMLNVVVGRYNKEDKEIMKKFVKQILPYVDSLNILFNDSLSDVSYGKVIESFKKDYIVENYGRLKLKIMPNSFLQSNSYVALKLYSDIKKFCYGNCLDLYSGIGSIALFVSRKVRHVDAVENMEENISAFIENIKLNKINNINVFNNDVKEFIRETLNEGKSYDVIIADPPRAGIGKKLCKSLLKLKPNRIILVSCNPKSLKQDYEIFKENYKLIFSKAYDMFSQTKHVECLFVLENKSVIV